MVFGWLPGVCVDSAFAKNLRLELPHLRSAVPRVARQSSLPAGVREKGVGVPVPFGGDLRQQKPALPAALDDEAVAADDDVVRSGDRLERTEQRDFDVDGVEFVRRERRKARVAAAGGDRAARKNGAERLVRLDMADAPTQVALFLQRRTLRSF